MIVSVKNSFGKTVRGTDGELGKIADVYFDDDRWTIRYFVVETGEWLNNRAVLISPASKSQENRQENDFEVQLTRDQVKNSPDIDTQQPISRRLETEFNQYYRLPVYWGGDAVFGTGMTPGAEAAAALAGHDMEEREREIEAGEGEAESHLRSAQVTMGYSIHARDGDAGKLEDFLYEDQSYRINFMVIDTGGLLGGKKVTLPPSWVTKVDATEKHIHLDLNRETVQNSPDYDLDTLNQDAQRTSDENR